MDLLSFIHQMNNTNGTSVLHVQLRVNDSYICATFLNWVGTTVQQVESYEPLRWAEPVFAVMVWGPSDHLLQQRHVTSLCIMHVVITLR